MTYVIVTSVGAWRGWQTHDELRREDRVSAVLPRNYAVTHNGQPAHGVSSVAQLANMVIQFPSKKPIIRRQAAIF
jgi:hypothetical protein